MPILKQRKNANPDQNSASFQSFKDSFYEAQNRQSANFEAQKFVNIRPKECINISMLLKNRL